MARGMNGGFGEEGGDHIEDICRGVTCGDTSDRSTFGGAFKQEQREIMQHAVQELVAGIPYSV